MKKMEFMPSSERSCLKSISGFQFIDRMLFSQVGRQFFRALSRYIFGGKDGSASPLEKLSRTLMIIISSVKQSSIAHHCCPSPLHLLLSSWSLSTLSQKSETVAGKCDSRRMSPLSRRFRRQ